MRTDDKDLYSALMIGEGSEPQKIIKYIEEEASVLTAYEPPTASALAMIEAADFVERSKELLCVDRIGEISDTLR